MPVSTVAMAVGCSTPCSETNASDTLDTPPKALQRLLQTPRPFNSPHLVPCKRSLEPDVNGGEVSFLLPCLSPSKYRKVSGTESRPVEHPKEELQRNMEFLGEVAPETPETKASSTKALPADPVKAPTKLQSLHCPQTNQVLEEAVKAAKEMFRKAMTAYALEKDLKGEDVADKFSETYAAEHYLEMKSAILALLPWAGEMEVAPSGLYDMVKFCGRKTPRREVCKRQLQHFRAEGAQACAWEALTALMAAMSSRKEKNWLEFNDLKGEIACKLKKLPMCKSKRSARRQAAIRELIPDAMEEGLGNFVGTLLDPRTVFSMTFARGAAGPVPATLMTVRRMPLWDAFKTMDDEGPLRAAAMEKAWCFGAGRQFALQDLRHREDDNATGYDRKERVFAKDLKPETELRDLLRSKKPVVLLDALAALAPRDVCRSEGLSKIVTAELAALLQQAKSRGEAVVFCLGSDVPHKLAQRVYLRAPLADYGMRCGCLRWSESANKPWAREFKWDDRITLCLQMP